MINTTANGNMTAASSSSSSGPTTTTQSQQQQQQGLKTYFKTPEGRYKLQFDKTHPSGLLQFNHGKTVSMVCFFQFNSFLGFSFYYYYYYYYYYLVQLFLIFTLIALSALTSVCDFIVLYCFVLR